MGAQRAGALALLLGAALAHFAVVSGSVVELTDANFDEETSSGVWMVNVYAPGSVGHLAGREWFVGCPWHAVCLTVVPWLLATLDPGPRTCGPPACLLCHRAQVHVLVGWMLGWGSGGSLVGQAARPPALVQTRRFWGVGWGGGCRRERCTGRGWGQGETGGGMDIPTASPIGGACHMAGSLPGRDGWCHGHTLTRTSAVWGLGSVSVCPRPQPKARTSSSPHHSGSTCSACVSSPTPRLIPPPPPSRVHSRMLEPLWGIFAEEAKADGVRVGKVGAGVDMGAMRWCVVHGWVGGCLCVGGGRRRLGLYELGKGWVGWGGGASRHGWAVAPSQCAWVGLQQLGVAPKACSGEASGTTSTPQCSAAWAPGKPTHPTHALSCGAAAAVDALPCTAGGRCAQVDGTKETVLMNRFKVTAFPSIYLLRDGCTYTYNGRRDVPAVRRGGR